MANSNAREIRLTATVLLLGVALGSSAPATAAEARLESAMDDHDPRPLCLARLRPGDLDRGLVGVATRVLAESASAPIGTVSTFTHRGRDYVARLETHYHPVGGRRRPWGPHRGVTLYRIAPDEATCEVVASPPAIDAGTLQPSGDLPGSARTVDSIAKLELQFALMRQF